MMIIHIPAQEVRKAVYDILSTKQSTKVYTVIPSDVPYPCITIGSSLHGDETNGAKTVDICDVTLPIYFWSEDTSLTEIQEMVSDVATLLTSYPLEFDPAIFKAIGQDVKDWDIEGDDSISGPWTHRAVLTFTAKIQYIGG